VGVGIYGKGRMSYFEEYAGNSYGNYQAINPYYEEERRRYERDRQIAYERERQIARASQIAWNGVTISSGDVETFRTNKLLLLCN
jgi:hypothetical protein